jgi:hypothetical protein
MLLFVYTRYGSYDLPVAMGLFILTLLGQTLLAITQVSLGHSLGGPFWLLGERSFTIQTPEIGTAVICFKMSCIELLRGYGTFAHPNILAGYALILLTLNTTFFNNTPTVFSKYRSQIRILIFLISLAAVIVSFSRLGIILFIAYLCLSLRRFVRNTPMVTFFAITTMVIVLLILPFSETPGSINERIALLQLSVNPSLFGRVFGVGYGAYLRYAGYGTRISQTYLYQPVHNIYLLFFVEMGTVGIILLAYLLLKSRTFLISFFKTVFILPLSALLIIGLFDHYPLTLQQGQLLFAFTLGVSLLVFKNYDRKGSSSA